ncbi:MAG: hypothetical protein A2W31_12340 [Planctomycetes bacterium RBG_16_64_10]|nr:MAG: hypothetical protein A2W31_12340 [Planctomycetes bacterium RBG_16_64_10]
MQESRSLPACHQDLPRRRSGVHIGWAILLAAVAFGSTQAADQSDCRLRPLVVDDPVSLLVARVPRNEQDRDQIAAAARLAAGRMLEHAGRQDESREQTASALRHYRAALRNYQRAFRLDSRAGALLLDIISLAQASGRLDEAAYYANLAVERDPSDSVLMRWLALYLADQGDWQRALQLYERLVGKAGQAAGLCAGSAASMAIWAEMGRLAYLTADYPKASKAFLAVESALARPATTTADQRIRALLTDNARMTYELFGEAHLAAGNLEQAEAAFRRGYQGETARGVLDYHLARIARRQNRPELALERLQTYLEQRLATQGTTAPYLLLADLLVDLNQSGSLVTRLESLHRADPENVPLACFLAAQYAERNQLAEAERIYQGILLARADGVLEQPAVADRGGPGADSRVQRATGRQEASRAGFADALVGLAAIYRRRGDGPALVQILARAGAQAGYLTALQKELAQIVADRRLLDAVFEHAEAQRADGAGTFQPGATLALAHLALAADRIALAARYFERAIEDQPDRAAGTLLSWGLALLDAEDYESAAQVFQRGIDQRLGPQDRAARDAYQAGLHFYQAGALEMLGATDRAIAAARQAATLQPDSALIASREPWIASHAGRPADARAGYARLIDAFDADHHDPATHEVVRAARFELSELSLLAGDSAAAEEWLEQVLDGDPQHSGALNDLGFLWVDRNAQLARALAMIQKAVAAEPKNVAYQDSLGWAYYRLGRYDDAVRHLEQAAAGTASDGVILDHLGDCYQQLGRPATAQRTWNRSVQAFEAGGRAAEATRVRKKIDHCVPGEVESCEPI